VAGWGIGAGVLFLRLSILALVAVLANFLAGELLRQIGEVGEARERSERWASMLSIVAGASRRMSLDPEAVIDAACDGLLGLGFEGVSLSVLEDDGLTYRVARARGLPEAYTREVHPSTAGMTGMVLEAGRSVVVEDYPSLERSIPSVRGAGFRTVVASPVWVGGWLGAVLIAGTRREGTVAPQEVEAVEMLAAQLGMALENIQRFEEERRTVERLAELDRLKGDFLTTVSHELRTPVTVIKGVGITLERTWDDVTADVRRELITGLNANATLLEGLIANLLDLSRVAGSRAEVRFEPFSLSELLYRAADRFRRGSPSRVLYEEVPQGLMVDGDPQLVERVMENLLSNVLKHTPDGTPAGVVASPAADGVCVEVWDEGPGVDQASIPFLGERFFRGGDINTRPKGLGLGLSLVREILDLHGSTLEVQPGPRHGVRFRFLLPAAAGSRSR
jgi:signal transduction histidine kinase